jgi:outer membrane protein OmpA-like peptidoglycan-associated protein
MQSVFDITNNTWGAPKPISLTFTQKGSMQQPSVSADGEKLYFSSKMEGSIGGSDIWMMNKNGDQWGEPVNLGNNINTSLDELFPVAKDSVLYFSSEGYLGYGGLDLFVSVFSNGTWDKAENMKAPFNSSSDDFSIGFNADNASGYFTSNRPGGVGADDIYSFYPTPVVLTLRGRITDAENNQVPLGTKIILSTDGRSDTVYITKTYEYFFYLDKDKDYKISVFRPGYFGDSRKFSTRGVTKSKEFSSNTGFNFDFPIRRIPKEEINIDNIYYDFGSVNFKEESKASLDKLAKLLEDTPGAEVQINSHTDEKGAFEVNMKVSNERAKAVADYLISKGIDAKRVKYKGWGYTQPVVKGAISEEDNQKNRRTTFQVLKHD